MALLIIVLSLFIERVWPALVGLRSFVWFERLVDRLSGKGMARAMAGTLGVLVVMVLPLLAVVVLYAILTKLLAILGFVFALMVMLFCLGPRDLDADVHRFLNAWDQGDEDTAQSYAGRICQEIAAPVERHSLGRMVVEGIVVAAHERWFGVIFWFVILGPLGALWYRLACELRDKCRRRGQEGPFKDAALMMHHILAWVPVRLTLLGYALAGSFGDALEALRKEDYRWRSDWLADNYQLLIHGGLGALRLEQELAADENRVVDAGHVRAALGLALRTLILAIAIIAVVTLATWVSW
ncbi:MAG: regulatory signaling modulator protein AmpE [Gammaproteobacteria bacterium]|jgi:AmpE protein